MVLRVVLAALLAQAAPAITPARQGSPSPHRAATSAAVVKHQPNRAWRVAFAGESRPTARTEPGRVVPEPAVHEQMGSLERQARVGMLLYVGRFDRSNLALTPPAVTPSGRGQ